MEGQRAQSGEAAGAAASNDQAVAIGQTAFDQILRAGDAIVDIDDAPLAFQCIAVFPAETAAAAVIDVEHAETAAGPELGGQF